MQAAEAQQAVLQSSPDCGPGSPTASVYSVLRPGRHAWRQQQIDGWLAMGAGHSCGSVVLLIELGGEGAVGRDPREHGEEEELPAKHRRAVSPL